MEPSTESRIPELGDVNLALLVSLVAGEHCIFSTAVESVKDLQEEIRVSCERTFGVQPAVIECTSKTTVDEFNESLLVETDDEFEDASERRDGTTLPTFEFDLSPPTDRTPGRFGSIGNTLDDRRIADVVIATGLDTAEESVQVQAFELLRSRRILTRASMHLAPKNLLFVAILSRPKARLSRHLNDMFCMSHVHLDEDGLPYTDGLMQKHNAPTLKPEDLCSLRELAANIALTAEMAQYLHNVVVFLRNSRYVKGGVTAAATRQFRVLSMALAPLHGLTYVPPSLVALAARKVYLHRLILATPQNEKSLLWGSETEAIQELLDGVTVEDVIEDVLDNISAFDFVNDDQIFQRTSKMQLPIFIACLFFMGFVVTASSWSITFYESKADCKGSGDRERYTSYVGSNYNYWTLAGTKDRDSGDCQQTRDGGHNFGDCNSGPLDTHKLYFTVGSNTHCRFSWTAGFFMPSDLRGTVPGDEGKCWSMTSAIGRTPDEFYFQCGEIDDPYWYTAGGGGSS
ncbi:hypothetical protein TI39_contig418g00007 [Zymoseptoria brevis]|uniref:Magnesium chelatase n=1 Tax=Zymoseptoria brevis TaxID=1047168 RepID=A0A0F4GQ28_9PEZI|nr:hypothetical protein TI39_contig418g00007 [Zymoseptoria brevis]